MITRKVKVNCGGDELVSRETGWLPDLPDPRDYNEWSEQVKPLSVKLGIVRATSNDLPKQIDLRDDCSPIENQGGLGSCTAFAGVGVVEYYQCRAFGKHIDGSQRALYKFTRNLMQVTGDTGAWLRQTMAGLVLCGLPPEQYWDYIVDDFDIEPPAFVYALADNFEGLKYFKHDPTDTPPVCALGSIKKYIAAGIPCMFGFYGYPSFNEADIRGGIPIPSPDESARWGHAIGAFGYDDDLEIVNTRYNLKSRGAFIIRNSWGSSWGDSGYGYLPYDYVLQRRAKDFWSLLSAEWVDTDEFGL